MKLIIDIPEKDYISIKNALNSLIENGCERTSVSQVCLAILNGTPLPKGHGRLIDVNDLLDEINLEDNDYNRDVNVGEIITLENIDRIPTIIEADSVGLVCNIFDEMNRDEQMLQVFNKSLCNSCITKGCMFQSGIVRNHCDFYKANNEDKE